MVSACTLVAGLALLATVSVACSSGPDEGDFTFETGDLDSEIVGVWQGELLADGGEPTAFTLDLLRSGVEFANGSSRLAQPDCVLVSRTASSSPEATCAVYETRLALMGVMHSDRSRQGEVVVAEYSVLGDTAPLTDRKIFIELWRGQGLTGTRDESGTFTGDWGAAGKLRGTFSMWR
jgi:hypothetical protein